MAFEDATRFATVPEENVHGAMARESGKKGMARAWVAKAGQTLLTKIGKAFMDLGGRCLRTAPLFNAVSVRASQLCGLFHLKPSFSVFLPPNVGFSVSLHANR